jgi:hypothetical protein
VTFSSGLRPRPRAVASGARGGLARRAGVVALLLAVASHLPPSTAAAQVPCAGWCDGVPDPPSRVTTAHLTSLGLTAIAGGITAGIQQAIAGESAVKGFGRGMVGGVISWAGKFLSAEEWSGAGFAGRQLTAVGGSVILNASEGRDAFDRVMLPFGTLWLVLDRSSEWRVDFTIDLTGTIAAIYFVQADSQVDWDATFSAGAPVLVRPGSGDFRGRYVAGVIEVHERGAFSRAQVIAHERVHVAQSDLASVIWSMPLEGAILRRLGVSKRWSHRLHFGAHRGLNPVMNDLFGYNDNPLEREARLLSGT